MMSTLPIALILFALPAQAAVSDSDKLDPCNVVWTTPGKDSSGSMPLGNGDVGLNVWLEEGGNLLFYISKTDSWDANGRLLKLGRVRVKLSPNPFAPLRQELKLRQGEVAISAGKAGEQVELRVWVDANQPVVWVEARAEKPIGVRCELEIWRTEKREIEGKERHSVYGASRPSYDAPDTVAPQSRDRILWFHRNESSIWANTLEYQGLDGWIKRGSDPLINRTFGGLIRGRGLVSDGPKALRSPKPIRECAISVCVLTSQTASSDDWVRRIDGIAAEADRRGIKNARAAHLKWWNEFWDRSWVRIPSEPVVTQGYTLQRFISACAGRGAYPIKFNGSIFTVDSRESDEEYDADYRRWGGCYWFQNTRLPYWPMLASGDVEMMRPLFRMYADAMPFLKYRTRAYFGHRGAYFPETMFFWGAYANGDYGGPASGKSISEVENHFIRRHYNGTLELLALMLDYYAYTGDQAFLTNDLLPVTDEFLTFWAEHYGRDSNGLIRMEPAQALETWQNCINPACDIAGLKWDLARLLDLPDALIGADRRARWNKLLSELPPLPTVTEEGKARLVGSEKALEGAGNSENPELYAVFPFRIYGVGKPDFEIGLETFALRRCRAGFGWQQNDTQAAFLGLAKEAKDYITARFAKKHVGSRFPAFWGPNHDWIPDQDHGANGVMALQTMLMQSDNGRIILFPAWPKEWDVEFKLHAPGKTTVEGVYRAGKLERLVVTPKSRAKDVVVMEPQ